MPLFLEENRLSSSKFKNKRNNSKVNYKWLLFITFMAVGICGSISLGSELLLQKVELLPAFIILVIIISVGIVFDIIGISVTAADVVPFHAMASKKIPGAQIALKLIKNADKVATFCNDVVGDVCGIVSGSVGAMIAGKIVLNIHNIDLTLIGTGIGTIIGSLTIMGKALGKSNALSNSNEIVFKVAKVIYFFKRDR